MIRRLADAIAEDGEAVRILMERAHVSENPVRTAGSPSRRSTRPVREHHAELAGTDLEGLIARATDQRATLEHERLAAAVRASA